MCVMWSVWSRGDGLPSPAAHQLWQWFCDLFQAVAGTLSCISSVYDALSLILGHLQFLHLLGSISCCICSCNVLAVYVSHLYSLQIHYAGGSWYRIFQLLKWRGRWHLHGWGALWWYSTIVVFNRAPLRGCKGRHFPPREILVTVRWWSYYNVYTNH